MAGLEASNAASDCTVTSIASQLPSFSCCGASAFRGCQILIAVWVMLSNVGCCHWLSNLVQYPQLPVRICQILTATACPLSNTAKFWQLLHASCQSWSNALGNCKNLCQMQLPKENPHRIFAHSAKLSLSKFTKREMGEGDLGGFDSGRVCSLWLFNTEPICKRHGWLLLLWNAMFWLLLPFIFALM